MKIALFGDELILSNVNTAQYTAIRSWDKMRWDKKTKSLRGFADLELLDRLSGIVQLPVNVEQRRTQLRTIQTAIDGERLNEHPIPAFPYPVKVPLYRHQLRGANMCLLAFGWARKKEI